MMTYDPSLQKILFSGECLFHNATDTLQLWQQLQTQIEEKLVLDCSGIAKADSSFLAILIEMRRWAHKNNKPFFVEKLPKFLNSFLSVYGIEEFLSSSLLDPS